MWRRTRCSVVTATTSALSCRSGSPAREAEACMLREVGVARVQLILDSGREYRVDDDALAAVLAMLDQVYNLRRQMRRLCDALEAHPLEVKEAVRRALPPIKSAR